MSQVNLCMDWAEGDHMPRLETFVGATGRVLHIYLKNADGTAFDLTGKTCNLMARKDGPSGVAVVGMATMTISGDASDGHITFQDVAGLIDEVYELDAQVYVKETATDYLDFSERFILSVNQVIQEEVE